MQESLEKHARTLRQVRDANRALATMAWCEVDAVSGHHERCEESLSSNCLESIMKEKRQCFVSQNVKQQRASFAVKRLLSWAVEDQPVHEVRLQFL